VPVAAYYNWTAQGRPLEPAQPIRELVEALRAAYPVAAANNLFSWYADDSHYQTTYPEDHTPFSVTGWPVPNPQWWVCATDIMHRPDLGVDCGVIFDHWIASARAGLTPWLKYLIWQGARYDVRNNWVPTAADGHFDHIHTSTRTDHLETGLGGWSPIPGGVDDMALYLVSAPNDPAVWLSDGMSRRGVHVADEILGWLNLGARRFENVDLSWYGEPVGSAPVVAEVDAAAVAAALAADTAFLDAIAQRVNDDAAARLAD